MNKINILLKGFYGNNNLGDDIILHSILENISSEYLMRVYIITNDLSFKFNKRGLECFCCKMD